MAAVMIDVSEFGRFRSGEVRTPESMEVGRHLGRFQSPEHPNLDLVLHTAGSGSAVFIRHRSNDRGSDVAAVLTHEAGKVTSFEWDLWHRHHFEEWMDDAKAWASETIAADRSLQRHGPP
jgi:hypothetical protein